MHFKMPSETESVSDGIPYKADNLPALPFVTRLFNALISIFNNSRTNLKY
ncbi:hypothetical protein NEILACOT_03088 [Neisseria lactamica ATCC 23970]|uniref:Uncharacterized protein n=1 Tax=Neisseria lactamica ATCC 23970 TaxID=546265 RepID=D0W6F0_NEILA|nr:hypothetical protein NEILACOT_03088 [Neisseria lactamica ATCC 23970]